MNDTPPVRARAVFAALGLCMLAACNENPKGVSGEPTVDVRNKELQANQRIAALNTLWEEARTTPDRLPAAREASKDILWKSSAPDLLRQQALRLLLSDTSEAGSADTRNFLRLRLPTEAQWSMVTDMCSAIQLRGGADTAWQMETAALVRSYARKVPLPEDPDRPERAALLALHPNQELATTVFAVFTHPVENGAPTTGINDDAAERARQAAWDLLSRIDPDGSKRVALISEESLSDPIIRSLAKCAHDLSVTPVTGSELAWLKTLLDDSDKRNTAWWTETSAAVSHLSAEQRTGLAMRHLEPIRWAAAAHSDWLASPRAGLMSELTHRMEGRRIWLNMDGLSAMEEKSRETLRERDGQLAWGDILAMLAVDEAVHQPEIASELFKQSFADRADTTSEHGGVLWVVNQGGIAAGSGFALRAYQPRSIKDDRTFIAPEEMFKDSGRALAHYHFHVQSENNREYAGPGRGDLEYAATHGRNCVVLTSVRPDALDVDYYQRNGAVIDLGEIVLPR